MATRQEIEIIASAIYEQKRRELSKKCIDSFFTFIKEFWSVIIKEELKLNWHIEYLADELQYISKFIVSRDPKPYDLIINIPPGTTKSTIVTIMFPAWLWTQDPSLRIISNSYSETLSMEHAIKSRDIIQSDKFKLLFPEVKLRRDKAAKSFYANTGSGSRFATSTGSSVTGEHGHCLHGNTRVKTIKGSKKIKNIQPGNLVLSYENGELKYNKVVATKKTLSDKRFYSVKVGSHIVKATGEHRFFTYPNNYINAEHLTIGTYCFSYKKTKNSIVKRVKELHRKKRYVYDIQVERANNFFANTILVHNCIINDDPLNPSQAASEVQRDTANEHTKTLATRKVDKENTPTITIMQRLHDNDVTGYLLKKKGEKIKHICLPAELSDKVRPLEVREKYVNGLLDPVRLSNSVLEEQKTDLGSRGYACQFSQATSAEEGNIVKKEWFKTIHPTDFKLLRRNEPIIFFGDTAYKEKSNKNKSDEQQKNDPSGFIGTCNIGNNLYITCSTRVFKKFPELVKFIPEWVKANGYTDDSTIRIEPKASGISVVDQLKDITKLNVTYTLSPTDSKETRLNASSPKIECGRVILVEGGWNDDFIDEICGFPARNHDEMVDLICYAIDYHLREKPKTFSEEEILASFR